MERTVALDLDPSLLVLYGALELKCGALPLQLHHIQTARPHSRYPVVHTPPEDLDTVLAHAVRWTLYECEYEYEYVYKYTTLLSLYRGDIQYQCPINQSIHMNPVRCWEKFMNIDRILVISDFRREKGITT